MSLRCGFGVAAILLMTQPASATTVARHSLEELIAESPRVLHGRVTSHRVEWDSAHQFIWTHYSVQVYDTLKGAPSGTFVISEAGGTKDGLTMSIPGTVAYGDGEEVLVFLHQTPIGYWRTYGYGQGKFAVRVNVSTGRTRVYSDTSELALRDTRATLRGSRTPLSSINGKSLQELKVLVRQIIRQQAAK